MKWLTNFMSGRYGMDQLGVGLTLLYFVIVLISRIANVYWLVYVAMVPAFFCFWRILSRNHQARRMENQFFLRYWRPVQSRCKALYTRLRTRIDQLRDREHKYLRCTSCGATLRVPRGKGRLRVNCPRCRTVNETRS